MPPIERQRPARPETRDLTELRALKARLPELAPAVDMQIELLELHRRIQLRVSTPSLPRSATGRRGCEAADACWNWPTWPSTGRPRAFQPARPPTSSIVTTCWSPADHRSLVAVVREGADLAPLVAAWYAETAQGPTTVGAGVHAPADAR